MKKLCVKLISLCLAFAMLFTFATNALAAPSRNTGKVKYLSEVALIEAKNAAEAQAILEELKKAENGGFEGLIDKDLNLGGKSVYLAYKSSDNVDDAITDLAVMNMNGDFSMGNYQQMLSETMDSYVRIVKDYRTLAAQFKQQYEAGSAPADMARRQLAFYYVEQDGRKIDMAEYMLNFPEDNDNFAEILFRGNLNIISNLRSLLAMGITDVNDPLNERISLAYKAEAAAPGTYNNSAYADAAKALCERFEELKKNLNNLPDEIEETKTDESLGEGGEDVANLMQSRLDTEKAFYELLCEIAVGDTTLGKLIMDSAVLTADMFYPVVGAADEAETILIKYDSLYELLLHTQLLKGEDAFEEALSEMEESYEPISVYHGVQNELVEGTIGVTGEAEIFSGTDGKNFLGVYSNDETIVGSIAFTVVGAAGLASFVGGIAYLGAKYSAAAAVTRETLSESLALAKHSRNIMDASLQNCKTWAEYYKGLGDTQQAASFSNRANELTNSLTAKKAEIDSLTAGLNNVSGSLTGKQLLVGGGMIALGVVMMGLSIWQLHSLYNKYNTSYTDIPDNMVEVVNHKNYGDRFVNYQNVPAYYYKDGKLESRENDLNAYNGREWVSLYFTKNFEAGYCLTTTADLIATEEIRKGYTPLHLFSHSAAYNLNSHSNREDAQAVYLGFKYSTKEKSAAADVPDVIGSSFSAGACAISGFAGLGLGMGFMAILKRKKKAPDTRDSLV